MSRFRPVWIALVWMSLTIVGMADEAEISKAIDSAKQKFDAKLAELREQYSQDVKAAADELLAKLDE
ncbi:MAG: hypothetical protein JWN70_4510, partial [Planctomycetaceae bacterium]|nr:hypothetical protein [Planctomycetaceae bacterium]